MGYQFDPRPEGLHYEPFTVAFSARTMWYLKDPAPDPWIDLRSVLVAMGMSWVRWRMYCVAMGPRWKLEACFDHKRRETLLAPGGKMPVILSDICAHLINNRHFSAASKVEQLKGIWRTKYLQLTSAGGRAGTILIKAPPAKTKAKGRKVSPYVVRQIHALLKKGHKKPEIAKALKVSLGTVQQITANTYKLDAESREAWWETFGADSTREGGFEGPNSRDNKPQ